MPLRARPLDDEASARVSFRSWTRFRSGSRGVALALPVVGLGLGLLPGAPRSARADDAPSLLVLGMQQEGRSSSRARASVIQHLQRMGEPAIGPPLGSADLACTQSDCLGRLARTHGADRILGAEVIPNDRTYTLQVWLYDVREGQPHAVTDHCVECGADELISMLSRLSGSLVESSAAPAAPTPPAATAPEPAAPSAPAASQALVAPAPAERAAPGSGPGPAPAARCTPPYRSFGRGFAIGLHGALAAGALATGIGLHAQSGTAYEAGVSSFNFQNQYRLAYGLTGAFALGLGAALMPWQRLLGGSEASAPVCPAPRTRYTFGRGIAAGAFAGLLAGGLVSSFMLTALDGRPYGEYQGQPASFHFQPHYTAGYIASAGMALGLGLSLLIP